MTKEELLVDLRSTVRVVRDQKAAETWAWWDACCSLGSYLNDDGVWSVLDELDDVIGANVLAQKQ